MSTSSFVLQLYPLYSVLLLSHWVTLLVAQLVETLHYKAEDAGSIPDVIGIFH
jgi:hypothetical protein